MSYETDRLERQIKKLETDIKELNALFIRNDEELRGKIRDIRIAGAAGVAATEFTLAHRMQITMDVVLAILPDGSKAAIEREIDKRVAEVPDTTEIALRLSAKLYTEDKDI